MNKYQTNEYVITLFDERGAKIDRVSLGNIGLLASQKTGKEMVSEGRCASFSIARNVFNSLDAVGTW